MDNLHNAFERYSGKNFQILSLSFDDTPEAVTKFREGKWKMPWLHTFVKDGFRSDLAEDFEVIGIPKPILVDGSGTIIATEAALRGANLDKTLARILGEVK